jgi:hypothetical protein
VSYRTSRARNYGYYPDLVILGVSKPQVLA